MAARSKSVRLLDSVPATCPAERPAQTKPCGVWSQRIGGVGQLAETGIFLAGEVNQHFNIMRSFERLAVMAFPPPADSENGDIKKGWFACG
jgi:hypothetical protein